ncbi:MAG: TonB-dependent receptor, partial [Syntrophobacter sp.]
PAAPWGSVVRNSVELYRRGDLFQAFAALKDSNGDRKAPAFHAYRALLYLTSGRAAEAESDLEIAISLDPGYSYAFALKSILALVQNRKDLALDLADKAVSLNSTSPAALIALSYVQQARFDLDGALANIRKAADSEPRDGLVWARLSELQLSKGELSTALETAREAVLRNPGLARTQTVLGFAYLAQIRIEESKKAFSKAIRFDQTDPLPRLGLGLALIRDGDLKEGRTEIEIAAMLDPNNSLIRSYLGKAYFEEKQDEKAAKELALAKELDPRDPTPWFYDAIRKDTINRPVEALKDLQKSMQLNDNRAVYRSRLLLDQDLAARSASMGRIYNDLGFQQRALVEGTKSLDADPSSFSTHRLLADSYASLPRHEIARVSELLQSQLLQPVNINPIQPQLAEAKLYFLQNTGPMAPSVNEYNTLFNRNRLAFLGSTILGERDNIGEEVVHSAVLGRVSYSVGQFHYQDSGFRDNNDLSRDIFNTFIQASPDPRTSVQAEYRNTFSERGDRDVRFDLKNFNSSTRTDNELQSIRFGLHHIFSSNSEVIGSFIHADGDVTNKTDVPTSMPGFTLNSQASADTAGNMGEIQHIFRSRRFRLISGAGYLDQDIESKRLFTLSPSFFTIPATTSERQVTHGNFYAYSQVDLPANFTWTLGLAGDFLDLGSENYDQISPKFGVTWTPVPSTTFRGAIFRSFQRPLLTQQTIEPTQVAGFNQLFDDQQAAGTDTWRQGVGVDHKFSDTLFGGLEFSRRDIDVLINATVISVGSSTPSSSYCIAAWEENLMRAYLYWAFHPRLSATIEFQYEELKRDQNPDYYDLITTYRLPFGVNYFHPNGFFVKLKPTVVFQKGRFLGVNSDTYLPGEDTFVTLDASLGVLLPGRWGVISLEARNLFDQSYNFQDTDPANPTISPRRLIFLRYTISF